MPPRKRMRVEAAKPEEFKPPAHEVKTNEPADFASISDKEMLTIFSFLPLCDLQSLELVSRRVRSIVLLVYPLRRSLSLLQAPQFRERLSEITRYWYMTDYTTRDRFGLDFYHVTREVNSTGVQWLGQRFPNITKLTLYCVDNLSFEKFVELIQLYPTLQHLVLFCTDDQRVEYGQVQIWTLLYGLELLRHFVSPFGFEYRLNEELFDQLDELPQLDLFRQWFVRNKLPLYITYNHEYRIQQLGVLFQSEENCQVFLASEGLLPIDDEENDDFGLTRWGFYLSESGHGKAHDQQTATVMFRREVINMSEEHITHLDLIIPGSVGLLTLLPELCQLNLLTHIRFTQVKTGEPLKSAFFMGLNRSNYRTILGKPKRTCMPSVRQLNLFQFDIESSSGAFLFFPMIFPRIRTLHLEDCPMANSTGRRTFPSWFLSNLDRFDSLRKLYHNYRLFLVKMYSDVAEYSKADQDEMTNMILEQIVDNDRI